MVGQGVCLDSRMSAQWGYLHYFGNIKGNLHIQEHQHINILVVSGGDQ